MKITKYEHSGVSVEKDGAVIVFDPIEIKERFPELKGVAAIMITHGHSDHWQPEVVKRILARNPEAKLYVPEDVTVDWTEATVMKAGDKVEAGGFELEFYGKDHAEVFAGKVPCANVGVIIDGIIVNPGDMYVMPDGPAKILLVPVAAPWCKMSETCEFVWAAKPEMVIPVHDGVLSEFGRKIYVNLLKATSETAGVAVVDLAAGESIEI